MTWWLRHARRTSHRHVPRDGSLVGVAAVFPAAWTRRVGTVTNMDSSDACGPADDDFPDVARGSDDGNGEGAYDPRRQVAAAIARVLESVPVGGSVFWGCEYVCPVSEHGQVFFVDRSLPLERGSCTLTFGVGEVSAELDFTVDASVCDGQALFAADRFAGEPSYPQEHFPHLLWVGPVGDAARDGFVDDTAGQVLHPAASLESMGVQVAAFVAVARPDVTVEFDPDWERHRHPLAHILNLGSSSRASGDDLPVHDSPVAAGADVAAGPDEDEDVYTIGVDADGNAKVKVTGEVMDVLLTLEIAQQEFLDGMSPHERAVYVYEQAWLEWTDGTFDPSGLWF